jgi:hypothetical protein
MRVGVRLTALLAFLLLILSRQTFAQNYIHEDNVSEKSIKQNYVYYIGGKIKTHNCNNQYD